MNAGWGRLAGVGALLVLAASGCEARGATTGAGPTPSASPTPTASRTPTAGPSPTATASPTAPAGPSAAASASPNPGRYVFPVDGDTSYGRVHSLYPATDIFAACGTAARSPVDGTVAEVNRVDRFVKSAPLGADKGGLFVAVLGTDGVRYYSSHFSQLEPAMRPGAAVRAGDAIGRVGRTGNANNVCHVHFAISPPCGKVGDWWVRRGVLYPWPYLDSWKAGGQRSPAGAVATWQRTHGCPARPANR
jgi:murein DD-endopeptidase MepM/ murein hydrolase activator NlpD